MEAEGKATKTFIILSLWALAVNLLVESITLHFKTQIDPNFPAETLIALLTILMADLFLGASLLAGYKKLSVYSTIFVVKLGIFVMLAVVNGHVLSSHWLLMPYNSQTLLAFTETLLNGLLFSFHTGFYIRYHLTSQPRLSSPKSDSSPPDSVLVS